MAGVGTATTLGVIITDDCTGTRPVTVCLNWLISCAVLNELRLRPRREREVSWCCSLIVPRPVGLPGGLVRSGSDTSRRGLGGLEPSSEVAELSLSPFPALRCFSL